MKTDKNGVCTEDAPDGFYAISKDSVGSQNACNHCDAIALCQENKNDWCVENRCLSYDIDGKTYGRRDNKSVIFKKI